jgi:hypothetical protein
MIKMTMRNRSSLSLRQKPKKIQKSARFTFSTGAKSPKIAQNFFQKIVKMYLVPTTSQKKN